MRLLIFDLDGTLVNTKENISRAVNYALEKVAIKQIPTDIVASFVGDGSKRLLDRCFEYHQIDDTDLYAHTWNIFYEYYYENIEQCTALFDGAMQTLQRFKNDKLVILTNKPSKMAKRLVKFLQIDHYFDELIGGDIPEKLKPNPIHLNYFLQKYPNEKAIMIGDSKVDILVAKNAHIPCIAFTHGFGKKEELKEANIVINSFFELEDALAKL